MSYLTTITLSPQEYAAILMSLRELENRCFEMEDSLMAESLYQIRTTLQNSSDATGAIASDNPSLD